MSKRRKLRYGDLNKNPSELKLRSPLRSKEWREKGDLKSTDLSRLDLSKKDKIGLKSRESPMSREWNKKKLREKSVLKNTKSSKNVSELNVMLNSKSPLNREIRESRKKDKLKKSEESRLKSRSNKTNSREN